MSKSAASSSPSQAPPKVVGPSYVDTRERTKPQIDNVDVAQSFNSNDLFPQYSPSTQEQTLPHHGRKIVSAQEQEGLDTDLNVPLKKTNWMIAGGVLFVAAVLLTVFIVLLVSQLG